MKKGEIVEVYIDDVKFPNKGIGRIDDKNIVVKNVIPQQKVSVKIGRKKRNVVESKLIDVVEKAPYEREAFCDKFGSCGGCMYQHMPYEMQIQLKSKQVKEILDRVLKAEYEFLPIIRSPKETEYRNKMEFSFGDEIKDGPLTLGMHRRNSFHSIVNTNNCKIVDEDYRIIVDGVLNYFSKNMYKYYHKLSKEGFLRYLIVRKTQRTQEILINLITTSQNTLDEKEFTNLILGFDLRGRIKCIEHSIFDGLSDVAKADTMKVLYGEAKITEEILGLKFNITSFSFFQTNSLGAEVLYQTVRDFIGKTDNKVIFDLYSGTGTIGQILAPMAKRVIGIEIVEEAVEKANENAELNGLSNCKFIAGDVLKKIDELGDKPDIIVLDPPREGIHPKAIEKIIDYKPEVFVYISCKPTSLEKDLPYFLERGYKVEKVQCCDMFPQTVHVETCVLLSHKNS